LCALDSEMAGSSKEVLHKYTMEVRRRVVPVDVARDLSTALIEGRYNGGKVAAGCSSR
jgi:hypothetical protein